MSLENGGFMPEPLTRDKIKSMPEIGEKWSYRIVYVEIYEMGE